jgi:hypothetical protein
MSDRDSLFRREALEFRGVGPEAPARVVRLGAPWLRWSYRLMLVLVVAGAGLASVLRADARSTGPAIVDGGGRTFSAMLPAAVGPELAGAHAVRLNVGDGGGDVAVKVLRAAPADAGTVRRAGLPAPQSPAIVLSGRVVSPRATRRLAGRRDVDARMTVTLRSERIGELLVRRFKAMLGTTGDGT